MIVDMNWIRKIPQRFHAAASFACSGLRAMRDYLKRGRQTLTWGFTNQYDFKLPKFADLCVTPE